MPSLTDIIALIEASKYFLLGAGSYIEGSVVMMTGGILWRIGTVSFWPAYIALMVGDILSDLMWYCIGYFGARKLLVRWGHLINASPVVIDKIEDRFHKYHMRILIISKLTMGFGLAAAILATAGMLRVSLVRYMIINILGSVVWVFFLMVIGYYFGNLLEYIPKQYQIALLVAMIAGFFLFLRTLNARLAKTDW